MAAASLTQHASRNVVLEHEAGEEELQVKNALLPVNCAQSGLGLVLSGHARGALQVRCSAGKHRIGGSLPSGTCCVSLSHRAGEEREGRGRCLAGLQLHHVDEAQGLYTFRRANDSAAGGFSSSAFTEGEMVVLSIEGGYCAHSKADQCTPGGSTLAD